MLTVSREVIPLSVGETDWQHADFDPPDLPDSGQSLDGRTIESAVVTVMPDSADSVTVVEDSTEVIPAGPGVTVNGRLIEPGTGVRFKLTAVAAMPNSAEARVKVAATLSDDTVKNLVLRFNVES